jgi:hypothetical protein
MAQHNTPSVAAKLQQLYAGRSSGALIIRGHTSQTARLYMTKGEVEALFVQDKKGYEAVPLLAAFQVRQIDFIPGLPSSVKTPLPTTEELLKLLDTPAPMWGPASATPASIAVPGQQLDDATRTLLEGTLTQYIGPMAAILCDNVLRGIGNVDDAIRALTTHIPDTQRARRFALDIRSHLNSQVG